MSHEATTEASRKCVLGMYESAMAGDIAAMVDALSEDLVVYEPSFLPYGGVTKGRDGFQKLFVTVGEYISLPTIRLDSIVADGNVVVAYLTAKTVATGEEVQISERAIVKNDRVAEMKIFYHEGANLFPRAKRPD